MTPVPDGSLGKSMFEDLTPNLSHAEKIWRCKTCGVEQDSFGPVTPAEPVSSLARKEALLRHWVRLLRSELPTTITSALIAEIERKVRELQA